TSLFEAAVVQWHWLEEGHAELDQYNSIHEALIETWRNWRRDGRMSRVHFACFPEDDDDLLTTAYLMDTALQAGLDGVMLEVPEIGWDGRNFVDLEGRRIDALFKLYPWDWMAADPFFAHIAASGVRMVEPAWRVIASSKALLAVLWERFPDHPNLLAASMRHSLIERPRVLKPILGREGANVVIETAAGPVTRAEGPYAEMAAIAQTLAPLPEYGGWHPVVGVWMVGGVPHGAGVREDRSAITGRGARFVPHVIAGG
ncbi:MAG TPA: glutathionylspermidine synthase family protein, partial [Hyphomicrobiaceae bacterium]|nr:glutathionylspermidine synthase family protein [Hyphomicrobiaceae bacterium]